MLNTQATAIATIVDAVTDTGPVFDYQPNPAPADWSWYAENALFEFTPGTKHLRFWTVQYLGERRERTAIAIGNTKTIRYIRWMVRGAMAWSDRLDSESKFRDTTEAVIEALDTALSLGGTALDHEPVQVNAPADGAGVVIADTLCHYVELTLTAKVEDTLATT